MTDEKMIKAIAAQDEKAMSRLIDQYSRLLWSVADKVLRPVGSDADLEECVADVFVFLWLNPNKFDPSRGSLKSYLSMVTRSRALNRYRQLVRHQEVPLDTLTLAQELEIASELPDKEGDEALQAAVAALSEPDREILIRRYYYDQKPREIAAALGLSVKQIDNRLYRTKCHLRQQLTL